MPRASSASRSLRRGIVVHLGKQCTKVEDTGSALVVHFGGRRDGRVRPHARLGRSRAAGRGHRPPGGRGCVRSPTGVETDAHGGPPCRTSYAAGDVAGYWQLAHTAFREGEIAAENATGHEAPMPEAWPFRGRSTPTRRSPASASRRPRPASSTATRTSRGAVSRGGERARRHVRRGGRWVKTIHETTYGELSVWSSSARTRRISSKPLWSRSTPSRRSRRSLTGWPRIPRSVKASRSRDRSPSVARSIFRRDGSRPPGPGAALVSLPSRGEHLQQAKRGRRLHHAEGGLACPRAATSAAKRAQARPVHRARARLSRHPRRRRGHRRAASERAPPKSRKRDLRRPTRSARTRGDRRRVRDRGAGADTGDVNRRSADADRSSIRPALAGLVPYEPGKPVEEVQRELGLERVVKLARTKAPTGPFPAARRRSSAPHGSSTGIRTAVPGDSGTRSQTCTASASRT